MDCRLLDDEAVIALPAAMAVAAMRDALVAAHQGRLAAPPRTRTGLPDPDFVLTTGALQHGPSGFRVYRLARGNDQLVAIWNDEGKLTGLFLGEALGMRRVGALGGAAADALAQPDARTAAIIGTGRQAWTQLWALAAVRELDEVRIWSPTPEHRETFATRAASELGLTGARVVADAPTAARGAEIVVLASASTEPLLALDDIADGAYVASVGPKAAAGHEAPAGLGERAAIVCADSPAQIAADGVPLFTGDREVAHLGAVISGDVPGRRSAEDIALYLSVGLAGTEVLYAQRVLDAQP